MDSRSTAFLSRLATVVASFWMGSLWTVCGVVATVAFASFERHQAGVIAATFFRIETWVGLALGLVLALLLAATRATLRLNPWIALTALPPVLSELGLQPLMSAALGAGRMAQFGLLHTVSAALFLAACVGALVLVLKLTRPAG